MDGSVGRHIIDRIEDENERPLIKELNYVHLTTSTEFSRLVTSFPTVHQT